MLLLNRNDIQSVFSMQDCIEAVERAYQSYSRGATVTPLRTAIEAPPSGGEFLFMPSYCAEISAASVKIVNFFPNNAKLGKLTLPAHVMLFDGETGEALAGLDGACVTQMRTGAASGVAFRALAKKDCRKGALIGTGGQAATQLEAMLTVRQLEEVLVYDIFPEKLQAFVDRMSRELSRFGTKIRAADSSDEAVDDADLLITVTPSLTPVFDGTKVKPGATLSCVGSYQPHMQEMDPAVLLRASKVYCDSVRAVTAESGDLIKPLKEGTITRDLIQGDLGNLLLGKLPGRKNDQEIIIFKTVGIGAQDLFTARAVYDRAVAAGIGTFWE